MKLRCVCSHYCSLALLCLSMFLLSACGQYGDLYLPDESSAGQQPPAPADTPSDTKVEQPEEQ